MVEAAQKCAKKDECIGFGVQAKYQKGESERRKGRGGKKIGRYGVFKKPFFFFLFLMLMAAFQFEL